MKLLLGCVGPLLLVGVPLAVSASRSQPSMPCVDVYRGAEVVELDRAAVLDGDASKRANALADTYRDAAALVASNDADAVRELCRADRVASVQALVDAAAMARQSRESAARAVLLRATVTAMDAAKE